MTCGWRTSPWTIASPLSTLRERLPIGDDPPEADSPPEFGRQHAKIVATITALDADIVGLKEIETDADGSAVDTLVAGLNAGAPPYQQCRAIEEPDTGGGLFGSDAITVAMIYRPAAVTPLGSAHQHRPGLRQRLTAARATVSVGGRQGAVHRGGQPLHARRPPVLRP